MMMLRSILALALAAGVSADGNDGHDGYCAKGACGCMGDGASWCDMDNYKQDGDWCNDTEDKCESNCNGEWCHYSMSYSYSEPSLAPAPAPTDMPVEAEPSLAPAPAPTDMPVEAPTYSMSYGYCCYWSKTNDPCGDCTRKAPMESWCGSSEEKCDQSCTSATWCGPSNGSP